MFWRNIFNPFSGKIERLFLSAKAIKTLKKLTKERFPHLTQKTQKPAEKTAEAGTGKHTQKEKKLTPKQKKEQAAQKQKDLIEEKTLESKENKTEKAKAEKKN